MVTVSLCFCHSSFQHRFVLNRIECDVSCKILQLRLASLNQNGNPQTPTRFGHQFDNLEHVLASATNLRYKLGRWLDWLPGIDASYIRTKAERSIQLVSQDKECCSSKESE